MVGAGSEKIAGKMIDAGVNSVKVIVDDFDTFMISKLNLENDKIEIKMMEYDATDFNDDEFDLVYSQGSISSFNRNKIIREIKRILKADGLLCVGEITTLSKDYPPFMKDIFESSDILPLLHEECSKYYCEKGFEVLDEQNLSSSLKSFYENASSELRMSLDNLNGQEKSYYKKMLNKISHESNAYLNLGADKYIGFKMLILKLSNSVP